MSIIISRNGKEAQRVEVSDFDRENYLQEYIYNNPDSIPLYNIKEDIKLLILAREFPTNSGPIDALGVDKDGEIYLVETKLYRNPDKRTVVAQVLDYGASLWRTSQDFNQFTATLNEHCQKQFKLSLNEKLTDFFTISEDEISQLLDKVARNLDDGNFKFVVLMNQLHGQLKDLIVFINENSKFDIFAVELEYYKHEEYEIMIPKLFGAEVKKDIKVPGSSRVSRLWDEVSFLEDAKLYLNNNELSALSSLYHFLKELFQIKFGTGATRGSFTAQLQNYQGNPLTLLEVTARGKLNFYLSTLAKHGLPSPEIDQLVHNLTEIDESFAVAGDLTHSFSSTLISNITQGDKLERLKVLLTKYHDQWIVS